MTAPSHVTCPVCGLGQRLPEVLPRHGRILCARCETRLPGSGTSRAWTLALTIAALVLYLPANLLPVLRLDYFGAHSQNTIFDGVVTLYRDGMWPIAVVVFLASIVVPLLKLLGLAYLSLVRPGPGALARTRLYRLLQLAGPWAMLDVFLVAVLVALLKLGDLATVLPGPGLLAFTGVVVLTLLASEAFDPRTLWVEHHERD